MPRRNEIGKIKERLAEILQEALRELVKLPLDVFPEDFWRNQGALSHATWDLASWGIDLRHEGRYFKVYSWDRMTDCVRFGIEILPPGEGSRDHYEYEISSKQP